MSQPIFQNYGLQSGIWSGKLRSDAEPGRVLLVYQGRSVGVAKLSVVEEDEWHVEVALPPDTLSDGIHSFLLIADQGGESSDPMPEATLLAQTSVIAGRPLEDDLRSELDLMRAELDLLKREVRRLATVE